MGLRELLKHCKNNLLIAFTECFSLAPVSHVEQNSKEAKH